MSRFSSVDSSKGFGALLAAQETGRIVASKRAPVSESLEETPSQPLPNALDSLDEAWDIDDYKPQDTKFPFFKSTGTALTLDRMNYLAGQVSRLNKKSGSMPSSPSKSEKSKGFSSEGSEEDTEEGNILEGAGRCTMEDNFVNCCRASGSVEIDTRIMELLGPEKEQQLFKDQQKIVEYFRHKNSLLDRKNNMSRMQGLFAGDDDAMSELAAWHGEVASPRSTPRKSENMSQALAVVDEVVDNFDDGRGSAGKSRGRRLSLVDRQDSFASGLRHQDTGEHLPTCLSEEAPVSPRTPGRQTLKAKGFGRLLRGKSRQFNSEGMARQTSEESELSSGRAEDNNSDPSSPKAADTASPKKKAGKALKKQPTKSALKKSKTQEASIHQPSDEDLQKTEEELTQPVRRGALKKQDNVLPGIVNKRGSQTGG